MRRTIAAALALATVVGAALAPAVPASGHVDEGRLGLRVTWVARELDASQRVRVRVRIFNSSEGEPYRGICRLRVWNADDSVVERFGVRIGPRGRVQERFRVVLSGTSRVRAEVPHCHSVGRPAGPAASGQG
jgi:hypothetical protein